MYRFDLANPCEALFTSDLQRSEHPDASQIRDAVRSTIRMFGRRDCAARVAQEFGDHPEVAVPRMRWARDAVLRAYPAA
jgi:hypothetical protein